MSSVLQVDDLHTHFHTYDGVVYAVNGVSFDLEEGETLAIVGESGCGKSVTTMSLVQLIPSPPGVIESGRALFHNGQTTQDLLQLSETEIRHVRGGQIGFIFQDPMTSLNPVLTIGEQIAESMMEHLKISREEARQRTVRLLARVGIPDAAGRYTSYPHHFSGGMRQRVMISIAVACSPRILIADEPTTALDVTVQAQIIDLVSELKDELGMAVIWITHDLGVVAGIADRVLVMYAGQVIEEAPVDGLYEHPQHPYTIGLLDALPDLAVEESRRLANIEGSPPNLREVPRSCSFAPRCPHVFERCRQEVPSLFQVGERHRAACFYDIERGRPRGEC
jgi:oligopeptide transport system ATP-binding protein